jgi:hypothetical protein
MGPPQDWGPKDKSVTTPEPGEPGQTAPIVDLPESQPDQASPPPEQPVAAPRVGENGEDAAAAVGTARPEVTFVPLAVTVGDGFKFGCGFFMAFVLAMLVGFVLLAALFALNSLIGLNLPPLAR